jgi:hypothetical protein
MGYTAVARVSDLTWTACAVHDDIQFGLTPGGQLDLKTTLCFASRESREPIVIDNFSEDPNYRDHHTSRIYNLQSYISVPIVLSDGRYFGNLCAIDPQPRQVSDVRTVSMFEAYAKLIGLQLEIEQGETLVLAVRNGGDVIAPDSIGKVSNPTGGPLKVSEGRTRARIIHPQTDCDRARWQTCCRFIFGRRHVFHCAPAWPRLSKRVEQVNGFDATERLLYGRRGMSCWSLATVKLRVRPLILIQQSVASQCAQTQTLSSKAVLPGSAKMRLAR